MKNKVFISIGVSIIALIAVIGVAKAGFWDRVVDKVSEKSSNQTLYLGVNNGFQGDGTFKVLSGSTSSTISGVATSTFANGITLMKGCFRDLSGSCIGGASSGANAALSNLSGVAINTSLVSDTNNLDNLGSSDIAWKNIYASSTIQTNILKAFGVTVLGDGSANVSVDSDTWDITSAGVITGASGGIGMWTNNTAYITATSSETLSGKSGNISMWTNNSNYAVLTNGIGQFTNNTAYITATSTETLTNKAGTIGMWINNTGYMTASSSNALTNKTGNISLWTNDSGYAVKANGIGQFTNNTGYLTTTSTPFYPAFSYATSTWAGTSTRAMGTAFVGETWNKVQCFTNAGTIDVMFNDGTNYMTWLRASTTVGTVTLNSNNTFTAAEKRYVSLGNPLSSPTEVSCTIYKTITP